MAICVQNCVQLNQELNQTNIAIIELYPHL